MLIDHSGKVGGDRDGPGDAEADGLWRRTTGEQRLPEGGVPACSALPRAAFLGSLMTTGS